MTRRAWLSLPIAALVGMLALVAPGSAQTRITPEDFADRIRAAAELAQLDGDGPSAERMAEVRDALGLPVEVAVDGWVVVVEPDPLLADLAGDDATDFEHAAQRLEALESSLADAVASEQPPSEAIAVALNEAYRGVVPPRPDIPQTILRAISEVIESIIQRIGQVVGEAGGLLATIILIGIAIVALAFLFRARLVPDRVSESARGARGGTRSIDWTARADEALRAGDLHEAVRALYMALLAALAGRGILADVPALTAGETRFAVRRARPAIFPAVASATDSYERVVYGGAIPDERDVALLREAAAQALRP